MSEIETNGNVAALGADERTDFIPTLDERYALVELNVRKLLRSEYFCGEELDAAALGQVRAAEKRWPDAVMTNSGILLAFAKIAARDSLAKEKKGR